MMFEDDRKASGMGEPSEPSLAEMTEKAVKILSKNEKGFFLMVEGRGVQSLDNNLDNNLDNLWYWLHTSRLILTWIIRKF